LDTLTEQAAVATDKIRLYETLEEKVCERTRQLEKTFAELKATNAELKATNAELKATKEQAVRNSLSAMSGGYVHRLNGALGFIPASLNFIKDQLDSDAQKILDDVYSGVSEALAYTKRMTNLFTGQELTTERTQINHLLQTVSKKLSFPSNVTKVFKLDPDIPKIGTDKMFLAEVFHNIIINALEAMQGQPEGRLEIGSKFDDDNGIVEIWFSDTGCGITKGNMDKLFDPQFTTKSDKHGSKRGIGLWFSKTVIDTLNGSIYVESTPGEGTTFTITLPVGDN
jgi:signal transduction histidine kinase